jgi:hypothetical protein
MTQPIQTTCQVREYRLEIRDDAGQLIKTETFRADTGIRLVEHADGQLETFHAA